MRKTVVIFAKAPRAGAVKTRLGAEIGVGRAAALFRIMTERTIGEAMKGDWETVLAVDPPGAVSGFEHLWPPHLPRMAQGSGDLGQRMARVFKSAQSGPALIIGSDAPGLRARHLREAFRKLGAADAVFGPAKDGGYWLIGLARKRPAPDLFRNVRWSTKHALADTVKRLPKDFDIRYLDTLDDIDEKSDLTALGCRASAR